MMSEVEKDCLNSCSFGLENCSFSKIFFLIRRCKERKGSRAVGKGLQEYTK